MNLQDFLIKYNGKFIEVSGPSAINQCVDCANLYIRDVLGLPMIEWTNAVDFPKKADSTKYDYILNTPSGFPLEGDLIIWGGTYGHIAIALSNCNADKLICFEQNNPLGTNCHVGNHNYTNVLGWLHPLLADSSLQECLKQHMDLVNKCNQKDNIIAEMQNEVDGFKSQIQHYTDYEKQLSTTLNCGVDEAKILGEITKMIGTGDQLREALSIIESLKLSEATAQQERDKEKERADNAILTNTSLVDELGRVKSDLMGCNTKLEEANQKYKVIFKLWGKLVLVEEVNNS